MKSLVLIFAFCLVSFTTVNAQTSTSLVASVTVVKANNDSNSNVTKDMSSNKVRTSEDLTPSSIQISAESTEAVQEEKFSSSISLPLNELVFNNDIESLIINEIYDNMNKEALSSNTHAFKLDAMDNINTFASNDNLDITVNYN